MLAFVVYREYLFFFYKASSYAVRVILNNWNAHPWMNRASSYYSLRTIEILLCWMKHCQQYFGQKNAFCGCGINNKCMLYISIAAFKYSLALNVSTIISWLQFWKNKNSLVPNNQLEDQIILAISVYTMTKLYVDVSKTNEG